MWRISFWVIPCLMSPICRMSSLALRATYRGRDQLEGRFLEISQRHSNSKPCRVDQQSPLNVGHSSSHPRSESTSKLLSELIFNSGGSPPKNSRAQDFNCLTTCCVIFGDPHWHQADVTSSPPAGQMARYIAVLSAPLGTKGEGGA